MRFISRLAAVVLACGMLLPGCASGSGLWVELKGERFAVEIADDDMERAQGLMFREHLGDGQGMLFIHEREEPRSYWMKNTRIPLDILYFDGQRRLVAQQRDVPPCPDGTACPSYPSRAPARFVLELDAGEAQRMDLQNGENVTFGPGIPEP